MINAIGGISATETLKASANANAPESFATTGTSEVQATIDTFSGTAGLRVGQEEYDKLFEGEAKEGRIQKSLGDIFSPQVIDVAREYKDGALERETASIYKSEWFGLSQTLEQDIVSQRTSKGVEKSVTDYKNGEPEFRTVFLDGEYHSTTHYGAYGEGADVTYYADGTQDVRTDDGNGKVTLEKRGPWEVDGREVLTTAEFENGRLARSRTNYEDGSYSISEFGDDVLDRTKEDTYRSDGTLKNSFVKNEDGTTKYKEFDVDGETVTYEWPPASVGK